MLGKRRPKGSLFQMVTIEDLVPQDHFLRQLDAVVDFSFIHDRVRPLYCEDNGRPATDPELVLRMFVLGFLEGIPEHRLCEEIRMHAGYRWFCRLDFHDDVPDRTTLVKLRRERWGPAGVFNDVMRHVVSECVEAGLVSAEVLAVDGTLVDARAATKSLEAIKPPVSLEEYLQRVDESDQASDEPEGRDGADPPQSGTASSPRKAGDPNFRGEKFSNGTHRSTTDPDARLYSKGNHQEAKLRFMVHNLIDVKSCVILQTGASRCSGTAEREAAVEMLIAMKDQGFDPQYLLADGGYTASDFLRSIMSMGIEPMVPIQGEIESVPTWQRRTFNLDRMRKRNEKVAAVVARNYARLLRMSSRYRETYRLRSRAEHLYAEAKQWHGMDRAFGYGLMTMDIQAQMTATVQNLKRLVRWKRRRPKAGGQMAAMDQGRREVVKATGTSDLHHLHITALLRSFVQPVLSTGYMLPASG